MQTVFAGGLDGLLVAGIRVPCDTSARIVGKYAFQAYAHLGCSVGDDHLTSV